MSNRSEINEYNVFYDATGELVSEDWLSRSEAEAMLAEAQRDEPESDPGLVVRTRVVFHTDWEPVTR